MASKSEMKAVQKDADTAKESITGTVATKAEPQTASKTGRTVYIGPTIPSIGLEQFQIFKQWPEQAVRKAKDISPQAGAMFVPVTELASKRAAMAREGSAERRIFRTVADSINARK